LIEADFMKDSVGFARMLRNRNFSLLWFGQIVSQFGDQLNQMALVALIYMLGAGRASGIAFSKLMFVGGLPALLFGPIAGVYVDRWNRRKILIASDVLRGVLVLSIPFLSGAMSSVYGVMFLVFAISRFFLSAKSASIPDIVEKEMLLTANSMSATAGIVTMMVGSGIGGLIVGLVGWKAGFVLDASTYFISALLLSFLVMKQPLPAGVGMNIESSIQRFGKDLRMGLKIIVKDQRLLFAIAASSLVMSLTGVFSVLYPIWIRNVFHLGTGSLGTLILVFGCGMVLSSFLVGRFGNHISRERLILLSFLLTGMMVLFFSNFLSPPLFLLGTFFIGLCIAPIFIAAETMLQENLRNDMRGKVFGTKDAITKSGFAFSGIVSGIVIDIAGGKILFVAVGMVAILSGIAGGIFLYSVGTHRITGDYLLVCLARPLVRILPRKVSYWFARGLSDVAYHLFRTKRRTAVESSCSGAREWRSDQKDR
jgi:MFS family permease